MITIEDVQKAIRFELNDLFCKGEGSGERFANGHPPKNPNKDIEASVEKLSTIIDKFFLDKL